MAKSATSAWSSERSRSTALVRGGGLLIERREIDAEVADDPDPETE